MKPWQTPKTDTRPQDGDLQVKIHLSVVFFPPTESPPDGILRTAGMRNLPRSPIAEIAAGPRRFRTFPPSLRNGEAGLLTYFAPSMNRALK